MKLCIVCAYPSTLVLSGLWKTCGSRWAISASLQLTVIQRQTSCVDKNLPGVSDEVTAPGVLDFAQFFAGLSTGNASHGKVAPE